MASRTSLAAYIPEDGSLHNHHCEKSKSYIFLHRFTTCYNIADYTPDFDPAIPKVETQCVNIGMPCCIDRERDETQEVNAELCLLVHISPDI
jgi:hypothetical protein